MVPDIELKPLGDITHITKLAGFEYTKHFDYSVGGEIIALRSMNIRNGQIDLSEIHTIPREVSDALPRSKLKKGDIVLGYVGSKLGNLAKVEEDERFHLAPNVALIRPNSNIDSDFLLQYMQAPYFQSRLWAFASSTGQPALSMTNVRKLPVILCSVKEQRKIAQILSTWDKAIATTEKLIETSKQQKKALMQQLLTGKKRLVDPETGKAFEGEWEEKAFSNFFDIGSSKRILQSEWKESGIPFFRTRELVSLANRKPFSSEIFISKELYSAIANKYGKPKSGDFLVSGVGTLGISYLVKESDEFYFKDGNVLWFKSLGNIDSKFFKYCFESDLVQNQIINQTTITTVGTYTITNAKQTKFLCPPNHREQQKIASVLTAADKDIELLEAKLAHFKQEKKALMQQLLTGKRRVKVAETEAA